jgi:predicted nucleotidyltransferase component of viral defense system
VSGKANLSASVRARLRNRAKEDGADFTLVLTRYALERILYRLSISDHHDHFLLKGALLFDLWFDVPHRPTRDADLLGFGPSDLASLRAVFRDLCAMPVDDGIEFDSNTVTAGTIRKEANYAGIRVTFTGTLAGARCPVQVDIGFGDVVTPGPEEVVYPLLLNDLPAPHLRVYPRYSVVSEKFEAMVKLGMANSRLKDYFDLWILAKYSEFEGEVLQEAIEATFQCRETPLPQSVPVGLSREFFEDTGKQRQWEAFRRKNGLEQHPLSDAVAVISQLLMPVVEAASSSQTFQGHWSPGGAWNTNG